MEDDLQQCPVRQRISDQLTDLQITLGLLVQHQVFIDDKLKDVKKEMKALTDVLQPVIDD